jgi:hypothetical protein
MRGVEVPLNSKLSKLSRCSFKAKSSLNASEILGTKHRIEDGLEGGEERCRSRRRGRAKIVFTSL